MGINGKGPHEGGEGSREESSGEAETFLTPGEVAAILHVDANTLARWANLGQIKSVRTLGGHRRYLASEVERIARHGF